MMCCCAAEPDPSTVVELQAERMGSTGKDDPGEAATPAEGHGPEARNIDFTVNITKSPGSLLGLELDLMDDEFAQVVGIEAGCVQTYNRTAPQDAQLQAGDFITAVNSNSGDAKGILETLKSSEELNISVRRCCEIDVTISKDDGAVGMDLHKAPRGFALLVHEVRDGGIQAWNTANPSKAVGPKDRITCVNGTRENTSAMMKLVKEVPNLELKIVRPHS
mmetsp:Transcript_126013/g.356341  ORF Transcript_126013/g.356341 Transcript_126013/m.356341 type:complete len:220 (-) Transcript_126013:77-736(-)